MCKDNTAKKQDDRPFYQFEFTDKYGKTFGIVGQVRSETATETVIDTTDDEKRTYSRAEYPNVKKTALPSDGPLPVHFGPSE